MKEMKQALLYLLLISYALLLVKPMVPLISDGLAHIFWKYEHVATVHKEHGTYHLHYEMAQAEKDRPDAATSKSEEFTTLHILTAKLDYNFNPGELPGESPFLSWQSSASSGYYATDFPPPKVILNAKC